MRREDTIEKEQTGEERARTQLLRAQETGTGYESTMETLRQAEQELPAFSSSYDDEIGRLYDKIINREGFRYDMNSDPLYMSYRDRYAREGRLAMKSTMGQAAALTGGYGSSYSQAVGQEQYGAYLNQFSTIGYKFETNGATILYPERLLRVMSCSSFSASDETN